MANLLKSFAEMLAAGQNPIANTQVADTGVAGSFVAEILEAITESSTGIEKDSYKYEQTEAPATAKVLVYESPCESTFEIRDVSRVRSLTLESRAVSYAKAGGIFLGLSQKMKARTDILQSIEKLGWAKNNAQKSAISSLLSRWDSTQSMLKTLPRHPDTVVLMERSQYDQLVNDEKQDLTALSGDKYEIMKKVVNEFYKAYDNLFSFTQKYNEEKQEILRFDNIYNSTEVANLLNKIPYISFTPAEIKALNMQETGDFTNTTVAGLEGKTLGFPVDKPVNKNYIGLGQHNEVSKVNASLWADSKGIKIPDGVDPRTVPKNSVLLTIAYFGWYVEKKVCPQLAEIPLDCLELKKMLFASYNAGIEHILTAIKNLYKNKDKNITWLKVAAVIAASGKVSDAKLKEMKDYAAQIPERLTNI